jgi:hypothetical protein
MVTKYIRFGVQDNLTIITIKTVWLSLAVKVFMILHVLVNTFLCARRIKIVERFNRNAVWPQTRIIVSDLTSPLVLPVWLTRYNFYTMTAE